MSNYFHVRIAKASHPPDIGKVVKHGPDKSLNKVLDTFWRKVVIADKTVDPAYNHGVDCGLEHEDH